MKRQNKASDFPKVIQQIAKEEPMIARIIEVYCADSRIRSKEGAYFAMTMILYSKLSSPNDLGLKRN